MSLRTRLPLAVGIVALLGLVVADLATYSALRSFLYGRVDQSLAAAHVPIEQRRGEYTGPGGSGTGPPGTSTFVQVRDGAGHVVQDVPATTFEEHAIEPRLPARITDLRPSPKPGEAVRYFTAPSRTSDGPDFRVRVSSLDNGGQLVIGLPLTDADSTWHHLRNVMLAVTGGVLAAALLIGWWLVRLGLRPLRAIEATAGAIAGGDLERRVPATRPAPRSAGSPAR